VPDTEPYSDKREGKSPIVTLNQLYREFSLLLKLVETRLDGMDKAQELFKDDLTRVPTELDKEISHLKDLYEEKFRSIETQFRERDTRTEQISKQSEVAINAALQAAKEAVEKQNQSSALAISKSEVSFTKQFDQIGDRISAAVKSTDDKFTDLKDRITMLEGQKKGVADGWGFLVGAIGLLATIGAIITMIISKP
jgi:cation transport regulator ChaB